MKKNPTNRFSSKFSITKILGLSVALSVAGLSYSACGARIVIDDNFDSGGSVPGGSGDTIGTLSNPTGIGNGWNVHNYNNNNGGVVESGSTVSLSQGDNGGQRVSMASIDSASLVAGAGATYSFQGLTFARNANNHGGGTTDRFILGVKGSSVASDPQGNPSTGFYVQWESDSIVTAGGNGGWNGNSILYYESPSSVRTILGSWQFDTLSWDPNHLSNYTPTLNADLTLGAANWAFSITGDTAGGAPIAFSGTYAGSGIANALTDGYAFAYEQAENPGIILGIDRIVVTEVPEPSVVALAGLGALMGLIWRRRVTA